MCRASGGVTPEASISFGCGIVCRLEAWKLSLCQRSRWQRVTGVSRAALHPDDHLFRHLHTAFRQPVFRCACGYGKNNRSVAISYAPRTNCGAAGSVFPVESRFFSILYHLTVRSRNAWQLHDACDRGTRSPACRRKLPNFAAAAHHGAHVSFRNLAP